ncbi:MAG: hypothetical protein ACLSUW_02550 [Akkermansia sp.]
MNVNDILATTGGDPLLFLDYLGISNLNGNAPHHPPGGRHVRLPGILQLHPGRGKRRKCPVWCRIHRELSGFCIGCCEKAN